MAEIIGVAASATQLGTACFSIIDLVRKIKGGASTLKRYHHQLQELQSLSTCISQNPLLQTPEIGLQTEALLSIINNNYINSLLQKGRLLRTWALLSKEQDLLDIFVTLDRHKDNLSLSIEEIQSRALYEIRTEIRNMADDKSSSTSTRTVLQGTKAQILTEKGAHMAEQTSAMQVWQLRNSQPSEPDDATLSSFSSSSSTSAFRIHSSYSSGPTQSDHLGRAAPNNPASAQYNNVVADDGYLQINGDDYLLDGELARELCMNNSAPNRSVYNNPRKYGQGNQRNGDIVEFGGDVTGATVPDSSGRIYNNAQILCRPSSNAGTENLGVQYNGNSIRRYGLEATESSEKKEKKEKKQKRKEKKEKR